MSSSAAAVAPCVALLLQKTGSARLSSCKRLDAVWNECYRTLREGGIICINIGDATRTLGDQFGLYPNHARILQHLRKCGFTALPDILWRKPTNAPN